MHVGTQPRNIHPVTQVQPSAVKLTRVHPELVTPLPQPELLDAAHGVLHSISKSVQYTVSSVCLGI